MSEFNEKVDLMKMLRDGRILYPLTDWNGTLSGVAGWKKDCFGGLFVISCVCPKVRGPCHRCVLFLVHPLGKEKTGGAYMGVKAWNGERFSDEVVWDAINSGRISGLRIDEDVNKMRRVP